MDINTLIVIIVIVIAAYIFIKLIVSPLIKAAIGIVIILLAIYILQKYFAFNSKNIFGSYATYLDITKWGVNLNWILNPLNYYIDKVMPFLKPIWQNVPKNVKL